MRTRVRILGSAILLSSLLAGCGSKNSSFSAETYVEIITTTTTTIDPNTSAPFSYTKETIYQQIPIRIELSGQLTNMSTSFENESPPYAHLSTYCECLLTVTNLDSDYPVTIQSFGPIALKLTQNISLTIDMSGGDPYPTIQPGEVFTESVYLPEYKTSLSSPTGTTSKEQVKEAIKRMRVSKPLSVGVVWNNSFCYLLDGSIPSIDMGVYSVSCSSKWDFGA